MILNTQQIVLLCLLVSFVTSITTGITTVSLMQQTSEPVTQTINRVIEKTVESVTQQPVQNIKDIISSNTDKEVVTVVVNQEDQSINAVAKNEKSIARIYTEGRSGEFVTVGVVVNKEGDIVVDKRLVDRRYTYSARFGDRKFQVKYVSGSETVDFVTMRIQGENPNDFTAASFGDSNTLKLAQSVISLSGIQNTSISTGSIMSFGSNADGSVSNIKTSVDPQNVLNGSVLLNLQGTIIGIKIYTSEDRVTFMPINNFRAQVKI